MTFLNVQDNRDIGNGEYNLKQTSSMEDLVTIDDKKSNIIWQGASLICAKKFNFCGERESLAVTKKDNKNYIFSSMTIVEVVEAPSWRSGIKRSEWDFGKMFACRLFHIGPIAAMTIIFMIGLTTTVLHASWWPISTFSGCLDLLIFLTWNYQVLSNMVRAAFFGGGYVPFGWRPPLSTQEPCLQYCHRCNGFKAPRSHHCMKCNRCVMKMDHHCPWINNCVGHRNQVFFIRFLFFAIIGCLHSIVIVGQCLWITIKEIYFVDPHDAYYYSHEPELVISSIYLFFAAIMVLSFAIGVATAVSFLFYIQLKVAFKNKTGIEEYICTKAKYRNGERGFLYPYDLGWRRNLREVFNGGNYMSKGNGVWWPIRKEQLAQKKAKQEYFLRRAKEGIVEEERGWKRIYHRVIDFLLCRN